MRLSEQIILAAWRLDTFPDFCDHGGRAVLAEGWPHTTSLLLRGGISSKVCGKIGTFWHWQGSGPPPDYLNVFFCTNVQAYAEQRSDPSVGLPDDIFSNLWGSASLMDSLGESASATIGVTSPLNGTEEPYYASNLYKQPFSWSRWPSWHEQGGRTKN